MTQFSTNWNPQINTLDTPYYFQQVSNVVQWQELEQKNKQISGFSLRKEGKKFEETTPTWISVSSSESWGSGVGVPSEKENVRHEDGEKTEESLLGESFQNNIRLPEIVDKGINIEEELTKQNLYKTELCKSWIENGSCRYGDKCQFAHGPDELRPIYRHPKYKTEICKTFSNFGTCPYGKRCRFVHSPIENSGPKELKKKSRKKTKAPKEKENFINFTIKDNEKVPNISEPELKQKKVECEVKKNETEVKKNETEVKKNETTTDGIELKKNGSRLPFFQKLHKKAK